MNIIVCIDKSRGMMFGGRRQSQDKEVILKIMEITSEKKLLMSEYSAKMFSEFPQVNADNLFLEKAGEGDFCFIEDAKLPSQNIEDIYVFNWNRDYPADKYFDFDLSANGYKRVKKLDFIGNSHKKITLEIFKEGAK